LCLAAGRRLPAAGLRLPCDDGIVVVMEKLSVREYFQLPETLQPEELVYGTVVREPAMPAYGHQNVVTRLMVMLYRHVEEHGIGICVSPMDVVLDESAALVVQPDILVVTKERLGIVRERIWGAPDLVVEVLSPRTARRDRTTKLGWYRQYGVRECWLVDYGLRSQAVEIIDLQNVSVPRVFAGDEPMRSYVLPDWTTPASHIFS
jgi:Uma2 family endonuclease